MVNTVKTIVRENIGTINYTTGHLTLSRLIQVYYK